MKNNNSNFHINFFNCDLSVDSESNTTKSLSDVPWILIERIVSQDFDLDPF